MATQIACLIGCIVTLLVFFWHDSIVCLFHIVYGHHIQILISMMWYSIINYAILCLIDFLILSTNLSLQLDIFYFGRQKVKVKLRKIALEDSLKKITEFFGNF